MTCFSFTCSGCFTKAGSSMWICTGCRLQTYFTLVAPLLPAGNGLSFAWGFRVAGVLVVACCTTMVRPILWPFMLMFPSCLGEWSKSTPSTNPIYPVQCSMVLLAEGAAQPLARSRIVYGAGAALTSNNPIMRAGIVPLLLWLARSMTGKPSPNWSAWGCCSVLALALIAWGDPIWAETVIPVSVFLDTDERFRANAPDPAVRRVGTRGAGVY